MSFKFLLSLACTAALATPALANGTAYTPPTTNTSAASSSADSWASGGAGGSVGPVTLTSTSQGGQGGQGGSLGAITSIATGGEAAAGDSSANSSATSGPSYSSAGSVSDLSSSTSKYLSLSLPQPVWTAVPAAFGCIVSEAVSGAVGWNFASGSSTKQFSDATCTTVRMAEAATLHCHFASAAHLNKRVFELMHKGESGDFFLAGNPTNLGPVECEDLKRPKLRIEPAMQPPVAGPTTLVNIAAPPACPANVSTSRFTVRKTTRKPSCVGCCTKSS